MFFSMKQFLAFCLCSIFFVSLGTIKCYAHDPPYKAVSLGSWLVVEGWMSPHLFDGIPNKDLLQPNDQNLSFHSQDGTKLQLKSTSLNTYLCAANGGGSALVANSTTISDSETFRLWRINETTFNFRASNKDFLGLTNYEEGKKVFADATKPGVNETFIIVRNKNNPLRVRVRASNGLYLQALNSDSVTANYGGSLDDWSDRNPSVFQISIIGPPHHLEGEYQLTNGYGPNKAPEVMRNHWNTYIVEDDFRFMSQNGLTAVRVPVGWWIMFDQDPPKPFVGGSLQALDNAFTWAEKYNMKVIIDLHAAPGAQNNNDHSGTRDGFPEWGASYIPQTLAVIDFLAKRYCNRSVLGGIGLLNEPLVPWVTFDDLISYYKRGYDAVRKYSSSTYVLLSNRLGAENNSELLPLANSLSRSVIEVHYYNLFFDYFEKFNAKQNIEYIYSARAKSLQEVTPRNGPLSFVGEWTSELSVPFPEQVYQLFVKAQLDVFKKATFGWSYWAYKCQYNHWSLRWMIENGNLKLQNEAIIYEVGSNNKSAYLLK